MSLTEIEQLYNFGKNNEALTLISKISDPNFDIQIFKCFLLFRLSKIQDADELANKLLEESQSKSDVLKFSALVAKARVHGTWAKWDMSFALELINDAEEIFKKQKSASQNQLKRMQAELLYVKGDLQFMQESDKNLSISTLNKSIDLFEEVGDHRGKGYSKAQMGFIKFVIGETDEAIRILKENSIFTQSQKIWDANALTGAYLSEIATLLGDFEVAVQKGKEAVLILEEHGFKNLSIDSYCRRNLAIAYSAIGQYDDSILEFNSAIKIAKQIGEPHQIGSSLYYLADIERKLGNIDNSIAKFKESLSILEEIQDTNCIINANLRLAKALMSKNDYKEAYQPLVESIEIRGLKKGEIIPLSVYSFTDNLLELVIVAKELGKDLEVEKYLNHLESFVKMHSSPKFIFQLNLAKALVEKKSNRAKYKIQAQNRLENLVAQEINDDELNVRAIINYCELLLEELKTYGEKEVLDEILALSKTLIDIGEKQKSFSLQIESLLLEGQLRLIQGEAEVSLEKFKKASEIATTYKLKRFENKASILKKNLEQEMEIWKSRYQENIPIFDRIEESHIMDYMESAIKMRDFLNE
ncbi:MAG: hypothetical protein ACW98A_01880 [Candidatus Hodarchaeales archaeon]|jgi:tetratricopeptide (TPR) repeat protein